MSAERDAKNQTRTQFALLIALSAAAVAMRSYHVAVLPLWLDEIYSYQLGKSGLSNIFLNSLNDPHPPLGYLIQALSNGFGTWRSEWGMRWLSVVVGSGTILLFYHLARRKLDAWTAFAAGLLFAFSPFHIFYSQEARSTALATFAAAVSIYWLTQITYNPKNRRSWIGFGITSFVGLYVSYSYALVIAPQIVALFFVLRQWRKTLLLGLALALCGIPFFYLFFQSIPAVSQQHAATASPLLPAVMGLLGGEPVRYGFFWGHWAITAVLATAFLSAFLSRKHLDAIFVYHVLQLALPILLFWGILIPFFHISMLLSEAKQFMVVLPSFFMLVGYGFQTWRHKFSVPIGNGLVIVACLAVISVGLFSLSRYWSQGKSPEGTAVLALRKQIQPGDAIVSLHHSLNAAVSFYLPDATAYTKPRREAEGFVFANSTNVVRVAEPSLVSIPETAVLQHERLWLLTDSRADSDAAGMLLDRCQIRHEATYAPFVIRLLKQCS